MRLALVFAGLTTALYAQPQINAGGIVNAASYFAATGGMNSIAQGSYFVIFGHGLGPSTVAVAPSLPFTTSVPDANGTSVRFAVNGKPYDAFMYYAADSQLSGILPSTVPAGPADVTVTYNGKTSRSERVFVTPSNPGIFTRNSAGTGLAKAVIYRSATDFSESLLTNPALPGQTVALYGTGLGPVNGPDNAPPGALTVPGTVTVILNGTAIKPGYAGRSPLYPGLDQINFQVPAGVVEGCYTEVIVVVNGASSNPVALPTAASAGACAHPFGLDQTALAKLDGGGTVNLGLFLFVPDANLGSSTVDGALGGFFAADANGAYVASMAATHMNQPPVSLPPGACTAWDQFGAPATSANVFYPAYGTEIPAGAKFTLTAPSGKSIDMTPGFNPATGGYGGIGPTGTFTAGTWTFRGSGGTIGDFSAAFAMPERLVWTSPPVDGAPMARSDMAITWTGGADVVAAVGEGTSQELSIHKRFTCAFRGADGRGVVPGSVLGLLPATTPGVTSGNRAALVSGKSATFTIPGKIDGGLILAAWGTQYRMQWQ